MAEDDVTTLERETGEEKVYCPNDGSELSATDQADGTVAYGPCPKCYKPATKAQVTKDTKGLSDVGGLRAGGSVVVLEDAPDE